MGDLSSDFDPDSAAKITHVSGVIRAACGAVIFDHPYNAEYSALFWPGSRRQRR
jgi:hypothetical protein